MDKRYFKILMSIVVILIIIIIFIILILMKNINNEQEEINIGDPGEEIDFSTTKIEVVTEKIDYYTVRNCINNYLGYLNQDSSIYYIEDDIDIDSQKENIYNILSSEYIMQNNISEQNVLNKVEIIKEDQIFIPLKMKVLEKENIKKFIAYGIIQTTFENKFKKEAYFIVNLDNNNKTYSIEPVDKYYNNIDEIVIENNNIAIENNDFNSYMNQKISNEYVTKEYFTLFKRLSLSRPEKIYNILSEGYRDIRFGNQNNFIEYINNNVEEIKKIDLKQYMVNNYEDHIEYVGKDQFGNLYIFNEYNDQSIDIKLDTYTINADTFIKEYEKATDEKKVQMNIDKFIQMINRHDYISSYNCISEGFRNNYFSTQEDFENYIKSNFFEYNNFEFKSYEKKGSNIYVYTIQLTDLTGESSDLKEIDIIMKLNEDYNFEMSFGM